MKSLLLPERCCFHVRNGLDFVSIYAHNGRFIIYNALEVDGHGLRHKLYASCWLLIINIRLFIGIEWPQVVRNSRKCIFRSYEVKPVSGLSTTGPIKVCSNYINDFVV